MLATATALCLLVALIAVSVGLGGLARQRRGMPWWAMSCGMLLVITGLAAWMVGMAQFVEFYSGAPSPSGRPLWYGMILPAGVCLFGLGVLLFSLGFCFHGLGAARERARLRELEDLVSSMGDEMSRMRGSGD